MTAPTFPLIASQVSAGPGVSIALTLDISPDNPIVGDLDLESGQIHFWDKRRARVQKLRMIVQFGLGEFWLNPDEGIPYFGGNIIGTRKQGAILGIYRRAFLRTLPDLAEIRSLTLNYDPITREAAIDFDLRFDDGMTINSADFSTLELGI